MSVNVSVSQLRQVDFVSDVAAILSLTGLPPGCLTLEFAEAQVMADEPLIAQRLHELKTVGVTLAIDGFGMGLSSLRSLGRFPVDVLKVARPLVAAMGRTVEDQRIAEAIVTMAHSLQLQVVAEGIEDQAQLDGVRDIQLRSRPGLPAGTADGCGTHPRPVRDAVERCATGSLRVVAAFRNHGPGRRVLVLSDDDETVERAKGHRGRLVRVDDHAVVAGRVGGGRLHPVSDGDLTTAPRRFHQGVEADRSAQGHVALDGAQVESRTLPRRRCR